MKLHSLRTRLVAATLLLLAVASAVVALVTAIALRNFLVARLDDDLRFANIAYSRSGGSPNGGSGLNGVIPFDRPPPGLGSPPGSPSGSALVATIVNGSVTGAVAYARDGTPQAVPQADLPTLIALSPGAEPRTVDLGALGTFRVVASAKQGAPIVVFGQPEARVDEIVGRLVTIEIIVTGSMLLLAGLAGAVMVRRELRPLERVAVTATRVSNLQLDRGEVDLGERVPDADSRSEVGQVGAALNRMLDHVGSALEARQDSETQLRQFIADASHELRTPLAAIRGYAELTRRTQLPEETTYSLVRISSQAERMTTLVEDLLLLARLDAGRPLERGEVDLTRLVLDAVSDAHAAGPDHRWLLTLPDEPVTVPGDSSRLSQVLSNLLANARTHTPAGTSVTVTLAPSRGQARIAVVDDGPGIPSELVPHVFERFARGSTSRSRDTEHRPGPRDRGRRGGRAPGVGRGDERSGPHRVHGSPPDRRNRPRPHRRPTPPGRPHPLTHPASRQFPARESADFRVRAGKADSRSQNCRRAGGECLAGWAHMRCTGRTPPGHSGAEHPRLA